MAGGATLDDSRLNWLAANHLTPQTVRSRSLDDNVNHLTQQAARPRKIHDRVLNGAAGELFGPAAAPRVNEYSHRVSHLLRVEGRLDLPLLSLKGHDASGLVRLCYGVPHSTRRERVWTFRIFEREHAVVPYD